MLESLGVGSAEGVAALLQLTLVNGTANISGTRYDFQLSVFISIPSGLSSRCRRREEEKVQWSVFQANEGLQRSPSERMTTKQKTIIRNYTAIAAVVIAAIIG
jgi:hypothetical protein